MPSLFRDAAFVARATSADFLPAVAPRLEGPADAWTPVFSAVSAEALRSAEFRNRFFTVPFPPSASPGIGFASDSGAIGYTTRVGVQNLRVLDAAWQRHRGARPGAARVLDFGCGTGRLLRHACQFGQDVAMMGCDVNPLAIAWIASAFPCPAHRIPDNGALDFLTTPLDLIYAWSIFTHFAEAEHLVWLERLTEKLAPGGILLATFKSTDRLARLDSDADYRAHSGLSAAQVETLRGKVAHGYAFFPIYDEAKSRAHGIDPSTFGQTFIAPDYIARHWSRFGTVREISPAVPEWQDLVVLQKSSDASSNSAQSAT